jgi:hypothetical protein
MVPLGSSLGLPLGGGAPPSLRLSCSLSSGFLYFTLRNVQSAALPFDAPPEALELALEVLGVVPSVRVRMHPRLAGGLYSSPSALCSGGGGSGEGGEGSPPVVLDISFPGLPGPLGVVRLAVGEQLGSDGGTAALVPLSPGSLPGYGVGRDAATGLASPGVWDADMVHGCHCDGYPDWNASSASSTPPTPPAALRLDRGKWGGVGCTERACPVGLVALSPGGTAGETQAVRCSGASGGTLRLGFKGRFTAPINYDASPWEVKGALEALGSIGRVEVSAGSSAVGLCGGGGGLSGEAGNVFNISFVTELGAQPLVVAEGDFLLGQGAALGVARVVAGRGILLECSGHGTCDTTAGLCVCFPGYASSNGAGGPGARGDCGASVGAGGT